MSSSGPLTFDSGLNSVSPSHSVSDSHLSSSQTQSKLNGDSGVNMSPPPVNLKTHPSLRRRSNEGNGSVARTIQRSVSQDASHASSSSHLDDDLQFSCGRETPSPSSDKSGSNEQLDEGFRPRVQQVSNPKEQYEFMRHLTKPRAESAPAAPVNTSNTNYINQVIPADMKAPVENYENTGLNSMRRIPPIPPKGTTENLATIQEGAAVNYKNHSTPAEQYENISLNSSLSSAHVSCYQNVHLDPSASPKMK